MIYLKGTFQAEFHGRHYEQCEVQSRKAAAQVFVQLERSINRK